MSVRGLSCRRERTVLPAWGTKCAPATRRPFAVRTRDAIRTCAEPERAIEALQRT